METQKTELIPARATHPGVLIKDELDASPDLNQTTLAMELGVQNSYLSEIINGKRPVTADIAVLLEKVLGIPANYWMRFQSQYEIDKARIKQKYIEKAENIDLWNIIKKFVNVSYFKRRGYLTNDLEANIKIIRKIFDFENIDELISLYNCNKNAYYRKSEKLQIDEKNMFTWSSLALYEAKIQKVNTFNYDNLAQLSINLNELFFENSDTIKKVQSLLNQYGIKMLLIEKLEKTPIDGFSFWSNDNPAIAMTLRHKRIDNFAFTLMHEVGHIDLHLKVNRDEKFMDLTKKRSNNEQEKEADSYAQKSLIPDSVWSNFRERHREVNDLNIISFSNEFKINPAIILGRVSYEKSKYNIKTTIDKRLN